MDDMFCMIELLHLINTSPFLGFSEFKLRSRVGLLETA